MNFFTEHKPSGFMRALALFGLVIAIGYTKLVDHDIWWHLKAGEIIWKWKQILPYDIFSYTAQGAPWINHEWLYQVASWLLYDSFGIEALNLLKIALFIPIIWGIYKTFETVIQSKSAAIWGALITIIGIADRIMARPFLFSIFFVVIFCLALHRFTLGRAKHLWALPLIQIVWINIHGGGIFGPEIIIAWAIGETMQYLLKAQAPLPPSKIRHLWLVAFACLAACTVNPDGIDIFILSFGLPKMEYIMNFTQEWIPALDMRLDFITSQIMFRVCLVITLISYVANLRGARFSHLALTAISGMLTLNGRRFTTDFLIINLPIIFFNLRDFAKLLFMIPKRGYFHEWVNIFAVAIISTLMLWLGVPITAKGGEVGEFGLGVSKAFEASHMVEFLDENNIHGKPFNEMGLGGYLIFKRWPFDLVFLDGRTPIYGENFYREFIEAFQLKQNFDKLDDRWHFDYLAFTTPQAWQVREFHKWLWEDPKWRLVFADPQEGFVYVRNEPRFKTLISKHTLKKHPLIELMKCMDRNQR